jgi:hypothetical protein
VRIIGKIKFSAKGLEISGAFAADAMELHHMQRRLRGSYIQLSVEKIGKQG